MLTNKIDYLCYNLMSVYRLSAIIKKANMNKIHGLYE